MDASADPNETAPAIVERLGMRQHPEGGWYVETWRADAPPDGGRPSASAILFLLAAGERSHWHRVDAAEVWQWSGGAPLELRINDGSATATYRLGGALSAGEVPQVVVPPDAWQAAQSMGAWTLVGCIVSPAFDFAGFDLAPPDWEPPTS